MGKIIELGTSRKRKGGLAATGGELLYLVQGTDIGDEALAMVLAKAPADANGLLRDDDAITLEPVEADIWSATVPYVKPEPGPEPPQGSPSVENDYTAIDFDGLAGTEHATQCIEQISYGPEAAPAIADSRVVGLKKDGVEGYNRQTRRFHFTVNLRLKGITPAHIALLGEMSEETPLNDAPFFGFAAAEVCFEGPRGRIPKVSKTKRELGLQFSVQKTKKNIKVGNEITVPEKAGWDYLWVMYKKSVLSDRMIDVPDMAFVSKIYERGDFTKFNHLFNPQYSG